MATFEFDIIAKIKCCHFILITLFKLEPPPRRAHVKFHHLISGEMLDGCELPPPLSSLQPAAQFNSALCRSRKVEQCRAVDCGVCDCDGVLGTGIKSQATPSQRTHLPSGGGNRIKLDEKSRKLRRLLSAALDILR